MPPVACRLRIGVAVISSSKPWEISPASTSSLSQRPAVSAVPQPLIFWTRSEEHTSELQSLMRISYAVFCLKKKNIQHLHNTTHKTQNRLNRYNEHHIISIQNNHHK